MKIKSLILATVVSIIVFTSCDDFLKVNPDDALPPEEALSEQKDLDKALNGMYYTLTNTSFYGCNFLVRGEVGGDDIQPIGQTASRTENYYRFIHRINNSPEGLWSIPYGIINSANTMLAVIDNIPETVERDNSEGEALAIRALCHFNLLLTYGTPYLKDNGTSYGVPLADRVISEDELPSRASVADGYKMVIEDLEKAIGLLNEETNYGHINRWAAKALLARVYLYKGDWDNAFKYADEVAQDGPYSLVSNAEYLSIWAQKENSESVFDIDIDETRSGNLELFGYVAGPDGYGELIATKAFVTLISEYPNDIRAGLFEADNNGEIRFINKYPGYNGKLPVNNVRVLRLSDIYLIAAEAALKKSTPNQDKADFYLNEIRKRAVPELTDVTATEELILKERRKELVMEGHRFYDEMRLGLTLNREKTQGEGTDHYLNSTNLISPNWDDYRIILAIPQAEVDVNPNIQGQQNPGYE